MELISVIVPIYNTELYLEKCLESICNQTYQNLEILLINDGSTDRSREICEFYLKKDKRFKLINLENCGVGAVRNVGIEVSRGEYIAFVDSDDFLNEKMYEKMYESISKSNGDLVICDFYLQYSMDRKRMKSASFLEVDLNENKNSIMEIYPTVWNKLFKKNLFLDKGLRFPENLFYEDAEFNFKLLTRVSKITRVPESLYHYIQRANSLSKFNNNFKKLDIYKIFANIRDYLEEKELYQDYKEIFDYVYIRSTMVVLLYTFNFKNSEDRKKFIDYGYNEFEKNNIEMNEKFKTFEKTLYFLSKFRLLHYGSYLNKLRLIIKNRRMDNRIQE